MAYDSKTYGKSPFGNPQKPEGEPKEAAADTEKTNGPTRTVAASNPSARPTVIDDGLDQGPGEFLAADRASSASPSRENTPSPFPDISATTRAASTANDNVARPSIPTSVSQLAGKLGISQSVLDKVSSLSGNALGQSDASEPRAKPASGRATRKSRTAKDASKKTPKKSTRKSKKAKAAELAQAEAEAAEAAVMRRFREEDRQAYLSLLYKTGISGLVWSVLRLSRYELPEDAIAIINIIIHPLLIGSLAFMAIVGLTFWLRHLLNDLARHTQQLHTDAEVSEGKNYRPTLEIVGDSLEYNPKLRQNFARLFNVASIVICTLISYLLTILPFMKLA